MTDPIADMLTRIRNAYTAKQKATAIPYSTVKEAIAHKLAELNYLKDVQVSGEGKNKQILVSLVYQSDRPVVTGLQRVSKPGRRVYSKAKDLQPVLSGYGSFLISTSQGIMSDVQARQASIGGEIICKVW